MGIPVTPAELALQPENLPDALFNAGVVSHLQAAGSTAQLLYEAWSEKRKPPKGGWPLDARGQPGFGSGVAWEYGMPVTDPRNPANYTWGGLTKDALASNPELRAWWDSMWGHQYPPPWTLLKHGEYNVWPKDLRPSIWTGTMERQMQLDPALREMIREYRTPTPRTSFMEAFAPTVGIVAGIAGRQFDFDPGLVTGAYGAAQDIIDKEYFEAANKIYGTIDRAYGGSWFGSGYMDLFQKSADVFNKLKNMDWKKALLVEAKKVFTTRLSTLGVDFRGPLWV